MLPRPGRGVKSELVDGACQSCPYVSLYAIGELREGCCLLTVVSERALFAESETVHLRR